MSEDERGIIEELMNTIIPFYREYSDERVIKALKHMKWHDDMIKIAIDIKKENE